MAGSEQVGNARPGGYHDPDFFTIYDWMWSPNGLGLKLGSMKAVLYARVYGASHHATGAMFETQSSLASSLGFSREKTSRALKELVNDGLIAVVGRLGGSPKSPALYVANLNRVAAAIDSMRAAAEANGDGVNSNIDFIDPFGPVIDTATLASCGFQQSAGRANVENLQPATVHREESPVNGSSYVTKSYIGTTNGQSYVTKSHIGSTCGLLKTTPPLVTCENVHESPAQNGCINSLTVNAASIEGEGEGEGEGTNNALKPKRELSLARRDIPGSTGERSSDGTGDSCTLRQDATIDESPFWDLPEPARAAFGRLLHLGKHVDADHLADTRVAFAELLAEGWQADDVVNAYDAYYADYQGTDDPSRATRSERFVMWLVTWLRKASGARKWLRKIGARRRADPQPERVGRVSFFRASDGTWVADRGHGDLVPLPAQLGRDASDEELRAAYERGFPAVGVG